MANEERWGPSWLQVILDGSGNWTCSKKIRLKSIKMNLNNSADYIMLSQLVEDVDESLWPRFKWSTVAGGATATLFHVLIPFKPVIFYSESSLTAPVTGSSILIEYTDEGTF